MGQLNNPRHELFAQALIKNGGHQTEAYMEIYKSKPDTARHGGSFLMRNVEIRQRINELMEAQGLGISELNKKLKEMLHLKYEYRSAEFGRPALYRDHVLIQMQALQMAYKIHGLLGHNNLNGIEIFLSPEQFALLGKEQEAMKNDGPKEAEAKDGD